MNSEMITTKTHSYIDYATSAALITLPYIFSGKKKGAETYIPILLGAATLLQSLLTDYEGGAKESMKMKDHLRLDYMNGALMAAAPFLFGFRKKSWFPHVAIGLTELGIALLTKTKPQRNKRFFGLIA